VALRCCHVADSAPPRPDRLRGGLYLVARIAPALAPTRTGRLAARVVDFLGGAAVAVTALNAYNVVRILEGLDSFGGRDTNVELQLLW
jgi:hypothetical protein